MSPPGTKIDPKLKLDMSFDEALTRFAQTKPKEVERSVAKAKQKKATRPKKLSTR